MAHTNETQRKELVEKIVKTLLLSIPQLISIDDKYIKALYDGVIFNLSYRGMNGVIEGEQSIKLLDLFGYDGFTYNIVKQ